MAPRGRPKEIVSLAPGKQMRFDGIKSVSVLFPGGLEFEFTAVIAILKTENGLLQLEKSNNDFVEVTPPYHYFEVSEPTSSE